ncbi:smile protein-like protein [Sarcoptes scabiei]|uniref:Smile protein-like protein n=1 Tax=Sarcoptes scabiei TaxID=52283 RepID=A0A132AKR2_SARSC|nr:smile protein-like protein [Sarcoptes scabiei]
MQKTAKELPSCVGQCNYNIDPKFLDQLYNLGVLNYRQGHLNKALSYFEQILSLNPLHENSLLTSARIIRDENIVPLKQIAYDRFNQLMELGSKDSTVYFEMAGKALKEHRFFEAKNLFQEAIDKSGSFLEAHYNLALLLIKDLNPLESNQSLRFRNLQKAIYHLENVLRLDPEHENAMFLLAEIYSDDPLTFERSEAYYQMILDRIDPLNPRARHNLCVLKHRQEQIQQSIDCFASMIEELRSKNRIDLEHLHYVEEQIQLLLDRQHRSSSSSSSSFDNFDHKNLNQKKQPDDLHSINDHSEQNYINRTSFESKQMIHMQQENISSPTSSSSSSPQSTSILESKNPLSKFINLFVFK